MANATRTGGKCGATYIDRNFNKWMIDTFGRGYTSLPAKKRGPGSKLMEEFDRAKRRFDNKEDSPPIEIPIKMDVSRSIHYDDDENLVKLTRYVHIWSVHNPITHVIYRKEMRDLFDPVIDDIIALVGTQTEAARKKNQPIDVCLIGTLHFFC